MTDRHGPAVPGDMRPALASYLTEEQIGRLVEIGVALVSSAAKNRAARRGADRDITSSSDAERTQRDWRPSA